MGQIGVMMCRHMWYSMLCSQCHVLVLCVECFVCSSLATTRNFIEWHDACSTGRFGQVQIRTCGCSFWVRWPPGEFPLCQRLRLHLHCMYVRTYVCMLHCMLHCMFVCFIAFMPCSWIRSLHGSANRMSTQPYISINIIDKNYTSCLHLQPCRNRYAPNECARS